VNLPIYVVGGFVRDLLLERPSLDFDIVVEGDAIFFARKLAEAYGGRVLTHRRFGTAKWTVTDIQEKLLAQLDAGVGANPERLPDSLDLITARTEFYEQPAALPTVESSSIKMDLHRRDFTINTLALRLDGDHYGKIHDYWGGLHDLRKGHIRVLHALSFVDDATRLLRAVRFEQRFNFQIEGRTLALMAESLPLLDRLSGARLRHEVNLILAESRAPAMLDRLSGLGILQAIHPALPWNETIKGLMEQLDADSVPPAWDLRPSLDHLDLKQSLSYLVWLGNLDESTLRSAASRLRFNNDLTEVLVAVSRLNRLLPDLVNATPSAAVRVLEKMPRLALYGAYLINPGEKLRQPLRSYINSWQDIQPHTTGKDLRQMGLPPSPVYGQILTTLRDAWLDGQISSEAEEAQLLAALVAEIGA
jgi:tRNA nucleotidyltransferase (CCA-adding enzyme)